MALRNIVKEGDPFLSKTSRPVTEFNEHLWQLLDDMAETMRAQEGVGLAAVQVGVLRRLFVMDTEEGIVEAINPVIIKKRGIQEEAEGCLSCPGDYGITRRPRRVIMQAQDRFGKEFTYEAEGLFARCICHETDHLDGILFKEHVIRPMKG